MRVQITTRSGKVAESVRERAEKMVKALHRFDPRISAAEVIFDEVGALNRVEIVVSVDGTDPAVAHSEEDGARRALDQTLQRIRRILTKHREQARDHRGPSLSDAVRES